MSLFQNHYKEELEYSKDVILVALQNLCELVLDGEGPSQVEWGCPRDLARKMLKEAYDSQCEWDLDYDDLGD